MCKPKITDSQDKCSWWEHWVDGAKWRSWRRMCVPTGTNLTADNLRKHSKVTHTQRWNRGGVFLAWATHMHRRHSWTGYVTYAVLDAYWLNTKTWVFLHVLIAPPFQEVSAYRKVWTRPFRKASYGSTIQRVFYEFPVMQISSYAVLKGTEPSFKEICPKAKL